MKTDINSWTKHLGKYMKKNKILQNDKIME